MAIVGVVGRQGGPGLAAVEGAADIELVGLVAGGVGLPVGGGGVHHHHKVAVHKAAVALGDVVGVLPGGVVQVVHGLGPLERSWGSGSSCHRRTTLRTWN